MIQPKLLVLFTLLAVSPFANGGQNLRSNKHNIFDRVIPVGDPFYPEKSSALKTSTEVSSRQNTKDEADKDILEPSGAYAVIDSDTLSDNEYMDAYGTVELTSGINAVEVMDSDDGVYNSTESNRTNTNNSTESLEIEGFVIPFPFNTESNSTDTSNITEPFGIEGFVIPFQFNTESNSTSTSNNTKPCGLEGFVISSQFNTSASTDEADLSSNFTETSSHQSNSSTLTVSSSEHNLSSSFLSNTSDSNETNITLLGDNLSGATESNSTSTSNNTEPFGMEGFVISSQLNTSASTDEADPSSNFTETSSHQSNSSTLTVSSSEHNLSSSFLSNMSDSNETNIALLGDNLSGATESNSTSTSNNTEPCGMEGFVISSQFNTSASTGEADLSSNVTETSSHQSNSSTLTVSSSEHNLSSSFLSNTSDSNETNIALLGDNLSGATDKLPRIVGGQVTSLSKYPFFVSLEGCGGTLIHSDIVLSAAHCDSRRFQLLVGPNRERVSFATKKIHPDYDARTFENDFLVIKLSKPFSNIRLPTINGNGNTPSGSQGIVVVGYGLTEEGGSASPSLREVTLSHVPHSTCNAAYGGDVDSATMFCAGSKGKDSCQGDSGGPLLIGNTLVGVVSWGTGCAREGYPGVNARVSVAEGWIKNQICCLSSAPPAGCTCEGNSGGSGGGSSPFPFPSLPSFLGCFSQDGLVHVQGKGKVTMKNLQVGDKVLTKNNAMALSEEAMYTYQAVYAWGHSNTTHRARFVKLTMSSPTRRPESIELTGNHLLYVRGKTHPVRADSVQVGDRLVVVEPQLKLDAESSQSGTVTGIQHISKRGIYAPLTATGTIVVNDVVASTYSSLQENSEYFELGQGFASISQHDICHFWMRPFRLICGSAAGGSLGFCQSFEDDGRLRWAGLGKRYAKFVLSQSYLLQLLLFATTIAWLSFFAVVECAVIGITGPALPLLVCLVSLSVLLFCVAANVLIAPDTLFRARHGVRVDKKKKL